jgi:hypothetical protein
VAPPAGDFHRGLVHKPAVADDVPARSGRVGQQRGEALDPAEDGDVVDLNPALTEELFDVAVGEPSPQIPTQGDDDDSGGNRNPANAEAGTMEHTRTVGSKHCHTVVPERDSGSMQQCRPMSIEHPARPGRPA